MRLAASEEKDRPATASEAAAVASRHGQVQQQVELDRREVCGRITAGHPSLGRVDLQVAEHDALGPLVRGSALDAAQQCVHAGHELRTENGLVR